MTAERISVIGAGAWGTALAQMLAADGTPVTLWAREAALAAAINNGEGNQPYLPGAALSPSIRATSDLAEAAAADIALLVTPAQHLGHVMATMPAFPHDLVLCAKGIEQGSGRMLHEVAHAHAPGSAIAVLSGPTFAHEVVAGLPTAVTLACGEGPDGDSRAQWQRLAPAIARRSFRPYYSDDVAGAEIGGAVKNVLAIACGVVEGLGLGLNARTALIARGYAEMQRFGEAMGGRTATLAGLCGLGDLVLTCSSTASRNFSLGKGLGEGRAPDELLRDRRTVAEGAHTAPVLAALAAERGVAMPITDAVCRLLEGAPAPAIAQELLARPLAAEGLPG